LRAFPAREELNASRVRLSRGNSGGSFASPHFVQVFFFIAVSQSSSPPPGPGRRTRHFTKCLGATAGVLFALGVSKGAALNFALASGLLLTCAALAAAVLGLGGSLLTFRGVRRGPLKETAPLPPLAG
jgi:hypothetical protein